MQSSRPASALDDPQRLRALRATCLLDLETDEELERVARLARRLLRTDAAAVTLIDDTTQWVKAMAAAQRVAPHAVPAEESGCQFVVRADDTVAVEDTRKADGWRDLPVVRGGAVGAYLGAPLRTGDGHVLGALCVVEPRTRAWTTDERDVIGELAAMVMRVVEGRTALIRAEASEARYRAITENIPGGIVVLVDRELRYALASGEDALGEIGLHAADLVGKSVLETAPPEARADLEDGYRRALAGEHVERRAERNGRTFRVTTVPVRDGEGAVTHAMTLALDVTSLVAAETRARELSLRDELTGLYNRRGFLEISRPLLAQVARAGRTALVLFVDLNEMKAINDRHGHDAGDEALRAAADLLRQTFRESDVIARLGGDEYAIFAPDSAPESARALRARVDAALRAFNGDGRRRPWRLSLSVGEAVYDAKKNASLEALLVEADERMYARKMRRREMGVSSDDLGPPIVPSPKR